MSVGMIVEFLDSTLDLFTRFVRDILCLVDNVRNSCGGNTGFACYVLIRMWLNDSSNGSENQKNLKVELVDIFFVKYKRLAQADLVVDNLNIF